MTCLGFDFIYCGRAAAGACSAEASSMRTIFRLSYQTAPETNFSEADRASSASETYWAVQSLSGTEKARSISCQAGFEPFIVVLTPIGAVASAHLTDHCKPRSLTSSALYFPSSR